MDSFSCFCFTDMGTFISVKYQLMIYTYTLMLEINIVDCKPTEFTNTIPVQSKTFTISKYRL